jgi:hypothetical protein
MVMGRAASRMPGGPPPASPYSGSASVDLIQSAYVLCPYCGETVEIEVDCSVARQEYIEDCTVCCKPMVVSVTVGSDGTPLVETRQEEE